MSNDWQVTTLDAIGKIVTGKTPPTSKQEYYGGDIPFITPSDMDARRTIDSTKRYLTVAGEKVVYGSVIPPKSVIVSCIGSDMGKVAICLRESVTNQQINSIIVSEEHDPYFLYYNLLLRKAEIKGSAAGSAQPILNKTAFGKLPILLPSLREQSAIAHILGTLDDKIELNREMNDALLVVARALFKSWFVDFDPVCAKLDGRWKRGQSRTGLAADQFDIFPAKLIETELGMIPDGWRISKIGEEVTVCGGSTPSTKDATFWENGNHCWVTPKDLSTLKLPVLLDTERKITEAGIAKISSGLLPIGTVLLSSRAPIGYLAIAEVPTAINQGFIALKCNRLLQNIFVLLWCHEKMDAIVGNANGSTFLEISKSNFRPLPVVVPTNDVLTKFQNYVEPLYRKIVNNEYESRSLIALRDSLLPKLISGELRVKDAEKIIGGAS